MSPKATEALQRFRRLVNDRGMDITIAVFIMQLFLVHPEFLLQLGDINFWDEANYINWGRLLANGMLPPLSENPLTAFFYMLLYLPFSNSPYWLVKSAMVGRFLLYSGMWWAAVLAARQLKDRFPPEMMLGLLLFSPYLTIILPNPSDAILAMLSGLALWQLLKYMRTSSRRCVVLGSLFLALAGLSRSDGIILFFIFLVLLALNSKPLREKGRNLIVALLPFLVIVPGYVVLRGCITGDYNTGIPQRSYVAFEQGHNIVFTGHGSDATRSDGVLSQMDAQATYGTEDENRSSVLRAIARNPAAYFKRLQAIAANLPEQVINAYHKRIAIFILLMAARGIISLLYKKDYQLLTALLLWTGYLGVYFLTSFRDGYLITPFIVVFLLACLGAVALLDNLDKQLERTVWSAVLAALMVYGVLDDKLAIFYAAGVTLIVLWALVLMHTTSSEFRSSHAYGMVLLLIAGLALRGNFPTPRMIRLGSQPDELGSKYLADHLPEGSYVMAGAPAPVWMAKMEFQSVDSPDTPEMGNSEEMISWLHDRNIKAIYLDYHLATRTPYHYGLIQEQMNKGLERVLMLGGGNVQIFMVKPSG